MSEVRKRPLEDDDYDNDGEEDEEEDNNQPRQSSMRKAAESLQSGEWEENEETWLGAVPYIGKAKLYPKFSEFASSHTETVALETNWCEPRPFPASKIETDSDEEDLLNTKAEAEDEESDEEEELEDKEEEEEDQDDDQDEEEEEEEEDREDRAKEANTGREVREQAVAHGTYRGNFDLVEQVQWESSIAWDANDSDDSDDSCEGDGSSQANNLVEEEDENGKVIQDKKKKITNKKQPSLSFHRDHDSAGTGGGGEVVLSTQTNQVLSSVEDSIIRKWGALQVSSKTSEASKAGSGGGAAAAVASLSSIGHGDDAALGRDENKSQEKEAGQFNPSDILRKMALNKQLLSGNWLNEVVWDEDDSNASKIKPKLCLNPNDEHLYFLSMNNQNKSLSSRSEKATRQRIVDKHIISRGSGGNDLKSRALHDRLEILSKKPSSYFNSENHLNPNALRMNGLDGENGMRIGVTFQKEGTDEQDSSSSSSSSAQDIEVERAKMQYRSIEKRFRLENAVAAAGFKGEKLNVNIRGGAHGRDATKWTVHGDTETEDLIHPTLRENTESNETGVFGGYTRGNSQNRGRTSRDSVAPTSVPRPVIQHAEATLSHRFTKLPLFNKHRLQRIHRGSRFDTWNYRMRIHPNQSQGSENGLGDSSEVSSISFGGLRNTSARMRSSLAFRGGGNTGATAASRRGMMSSLKEEKDLDIPAFPSPQEMDDFVIIEYIEENLLYRTFPGMASKLHRFYQYTKSEEEKLDSQEKKRKRDLIQKVNDDTEAQVGAVVAEEVDSRIYEDESDAYFPYRRELADVDTALSRPVGEAFLWWAGWDANQPPLGGRYLRPKRRQTTHHRTSNTFHMLAPAMDDAGYEICGLTPTAKYHSPDDLIKEELARKLKLELEAAEREALESETNVNGNSSGSSGKQLNKSDSIAGNSQGKSDEDDAMEDDDDLNTVSSPRSPSSLSKPRRDVLVEKEVGERKPMRKAQAPFLAHLKMGEEQLAIDNKLYRAPLYKHQPRRTDFLLVCYDDDQECTIFLTYELPKDFLNADHKKIQSNKAAWRALGLSKDFIEGDPVHKEHDLNERDKAILYEVFTKVYRMSTGSISSGSAYNGGSYDEDDGESNMSSGGSLPAYVEIPITHPNDEIKKLYLENSPLLRKQLHEKVISRSSFQAWGVPSSGFGPLRGGNADGGAPKGKSVKNLGLLNTQKGTAPYTVNVAIRELPRNRTFVCGQMEPQETVPAPKSPNFNAALRDLVYHQLAKLFDNLRHQENGSISQKDILWDVFTDNSVNPPYRLFPGIDMKHTYKNHPPKNTERAEFEKKESEWLTSNIVREKLRQVADSKQRLWEPKPLRGAADAMNMDNGLTDSDYGVLPDDVARSGDYTPEKVSMLLSSMTWDRKLKDLGVSQLQDSRRHKQLMAEFPNVISALASISEAAKKRAKDAHDLFVSETRKAVAGGNALPSFAQPVASDSSSSFKGRDKHQKMNRNTHGKKNATSAGGGGGGTNSLSHLPASLRLPVLNSEQLIMLTKGQKSVYWRGQYAVQQFNRKLKAAKLLKIARAIFIEMQMSSWYITSCFVDGHLKDKNHLKLAGIGEGDPSGHGAGFCFVLKDKRAPQKPGNKSGRKQQLANDDKKDLRKLNGHQRKEILLELGLPEEEIKKLSRWEQTRTISELAKFSDLEKYKDRYIRSATLTMHEDQEKYEERARVIWDKQAQELKSSVIYRDKDDSDDDSDSDSDSDDSDDSEDDLVRNEPINDDEINYADRHELAALQQGGGGSHQQFASNNRQAGAGVDPNVIRPQKVIRRIVRYKLKDGTEKSMVEFRVVPDDELREVELRIEQLKKEKAQAALESRSQSQHTPGKNIDRLLYANKGASSSASGTLTSGKLVLKNPGKEAQKRPTLNISAMMKKVDNSKVIKKREQEAKERERQEIYKRPAVKEASRKDRQQQRAAKPHVKLASMFLSVIEDICKRPTAQVFLRPVPRTVPNYHTVVRTPIDLSTIRNRCSNDYKYRDRKSFLAEFELMLKNAEAFNGPEHEITEEARNILQLAQETIDSDPQFEEVEVECGKQTIITLAGRGGKNKGRSAGGGTANSSSKQRSPPKAAAASRPFTVRLNRPAAPPTASPAATAASSVSAPSTAPISASQQDEDDSSSGEEEVIEQSQI